MPVPTPISSQLPTAAEPAAGTAAATAGEPAPEAPVATTAPTALPTVAPASTAVPASTPTPASTLPPADTPTPGAPPATSAAAPENPLVAAPAPLSRPAEAAPSAEAPPASEESELLAIHALERHGQIREALARAMRLADAHPQFRDAQFAAAELAYLTLRWAEAVTYFQRGGDPGNQHPMLLLYEAISLYETGDRTDAAAVLRRALPGVRRTRYVNDYARKILGRGTGPATPKTQAATGPAGG